MTGSNLPPGVNVNDIPGNRPEDIESEKFWEALDEQFVKQYGDRAKKWLVMLEDIDPEDMIFEYVETAREIAYQKGYGDAVDIVEYECDHKWRDYSEYGGDYEENPIVCKHCGKVAPPDVVEIFKREN